jgi:hypothetical protein
VAELQPAGAPGAPPQPQHAVQPLWQSGACALADPPPPLRAAAAAEAGCGAAGAPRVRLLLAAAWSGAGSSRRLQIAHWPSLLPLHPLAAQELLAYVARARARLRLGAAAPCPAPSGSSARRRAPCAACP